MKLKRSERMVVISNYLINNPYKLTSLNTFAERYEAAKSSISEDVAIIKKALPATIKIKNKEKIFMKLSARNQLKGKVININKGAVNSIVSIDIGGGNIITATISCAAVEELELKVGSDAYAVIKATSVMVGIDE